MNSYDIDTRAVEARLERYHAAIDALLAHAGIVIRPATADPTFCDHGVPIVLDCTTCEPPLDAFDENAWQGARDEGVLT